MHRMTKQRMAILNSLKKSERPLYVEEILTKASEETPRINLSTVYRTIKMLVKEEKVSSIELPGDKKCYEIPAEKHRHYFLCDGCEKIYFIHDCPKGLSKIVPKGFHVRKHAITFSGFCMNCND